MQGGNVAVLLRSFGCYLDVAVSIKAKRRVSLGSEGLSIPGAAFVQRDILQDTIINLLGSLVDHGVCGAIMWCERYASQTLLLSADAFELLLQGEYLGFRVIGAFKPGLEVLQGEGLSLEGKSAKHCGECAVCRGCQQRIEMLHKHCIIDAGRLLWRAEGELCKGRYVACNKGLEHVSGHPEFEASGLKGGCRIQGHAHKKLGCL